MMPTTRECSTVSLAFRLVSQGHEYEPCLLHKACYIVIVSDGYIYICIAIISDEYTASDGIFILISKARTPEAMKRADPRARGSRPVWNAFFMVVEWS